VSTIEAEEGRSIALRALMRGWLDLHQVWEVATRLASAGEGAGLAEIFEGLLDAEQRELLGAEQAADPMGEAEMAQQQTLAASALGAEALFATPPARTAEIAGSLDEGMMPDPIQAEFPSASRYRVGEELGRGGCGRVLYAQDLAIGRTVALKTLRAQSPARAEVRTFLREARITGQLEHPSIITVHDLGVLPSGLPFYTMPVVKHRSLHEIVLQPPPREGWPLTRLCTALLQVCRALAYAHARGVLHRDLKPENILLGDFGEVYVADWGIAKLLGADAGGIPLEPAEIPDAGRGEPTPRAAPPSLEPEWAQTQPEETAPTLIHPATPGSTVQGSLLGTPGYMAPEQVRGAWDEVDARTDLFALGCILYEILTGTQAFPGRTAIEALAATLHVQPTPPRAVAPSCPWVLDDLCVALLDKDRERRPPSAEAVAIELEAFLEGRKEKLRRQEQAREAVARAEEPLARYQALDGERDRLMVRAQALLRDVEPWAPLEAKRPAWDLEDAAEAAAIDQARALSEATGRLSQALALDPECESARAGLSGLHWSQARRARAEHRDASQLYHEAMALKHDDGRYAAILGASALLSLETRPSGAEVVAQRLEPEDRRLRPGPEEPLGRTPLRELRLEPGSYLLTIRHPGYRDVRYPLVGERGEHREARINLYTDAEIGEGFIYIPGGPCVLGGDGEAFDPLPLQHLELPDFAIARFHVSYDAYLDFIHSLEALDPEEALRRLPHTMKTDELCVTRGADGRWAPAWEEIIEGEEGRRHCPRERAGELGVDSVSWFDARRYAAWYSEHFGLSVRLPTEAEWEKAARGPGGNLFPWGDHFDATFCKMRESRPGFGQPEPIGAFPSDVSVYGVRDLAGSMCCWAADIHAERSPEQFAQEPEPAAEAAREDGGMRIARGGAWLYSARLTRAASRYRVFGLGRNPHVGIRLARSLDPSLRDPAR